MESNLFKIESEYLQIVDELEQNEGELTPELEEALTINAENRDAKFLAYIHVIKQKEADNKLAKDELDRIRTFTKRNDTTIKKLKGKLMEAMRLFEMFGKTGNLSYKVGNYSMFSRNSIATVVNDENPLTYEQSLEIAEFVKYGITAKLTKAEIDAIIVAVPRLEPSLETVVVPNKPLIKETLLAMEQANNTIAAIQYEELSKNPDAKFEPTPERPLQTLAELVNNESLTIR